jgi:hypothetical protein
MFGVLMVLSFSCSKDHENLPTAFEYTPPPTPADSDFVVTGGEERSILSWSYPAEARAAVKEFKVYAYFPPYDMIDSIGTTTETFYVDSLLVGNLFYCYEISAVDTSGLEGWRTVPKCAFVKSAH